MAQYDLLLTQNTHPTGTDFEEKYVNLKGNKLLYGDADGEPKALPAHTKVGQILKATAADGVFAWANNYGTVEDTFQIGVNGIRIRNETTGLAILSSDSVSYAGLDVGDLTTTTAKAGSIFSPFMATKDNDLVTKKYLDDEILAGFTANDAMLFKGSIGVEGVITSEDTAINNKVFGSTFSYIAGWVFLVDVAQTVPAGGFVCDAGDKLWCIAPNSTPFAYNSSDWRVAEGNIVGAVSADAALTAGLVILGGNTKKVTALSSPASPLNKVLVSNVLGKAAWSSTVKYENPMTEAGDIVIGGDDGAATRLAKGADGDVLKLVSGVPAWGAGGTGSTYTHPTTPGYKHLPAGGATKQMLQWTADGDAKWIDISGDITIADNGATVIGNQKVGFDKIVNSAAAGLSVLGRPVNSAGSFSEIAAGADGEVMRRNGNTLNFGRVLSTSLELNETAFNPAVAGFVGQVIVTKNWLYRCHTAGIGADKWKRIPFASFTT
jgi:hypothetical protein